CMQGIEFPLTF
nr:immunoglobulin light chain junction region [Macaca mulatta]MOW61695.1 immunoglobulin light chain junction region [Macaca mulatta]MOW61715.1 immunoglobulin light chain junction region [Macaca mulatta]MOW61718.1 immunoglobulin light chain junction region [Macaca mulatta]MOW61720.1 immunoglobulin light chain junction region [Macaca mulatta]